MRNASLKNKPMIGLAAAMLAVMLAAGCGDSTAVSGRVTYEGRPLAKGLISFVPSDGQGPSCGGAIANGQYRVALSAGKKRVRILETKVADHVPTRQELEAAQKTKPGGKDDNGVMPPNAEGNDVEVEIVSGGQSLDFALKTPANLHTGKASGRK